MGAWGAGLYSDDTTCDVRDDFKAHLESGSSPARAEKAILEACDDVISIPEVECLVYFALADTEWKYGCLSRRVKQRALKLLGDGGDVKYWEADSPANAKKRVKVLATLRARLSSPPPPRKQVKQKSQKPPKKQVECPVGTVFALPLPRGQCAALLFVGLRPVGNIAEAVFRLLPWRGKEIPAPSVLRKISKRKVLISDHHEFSLLKADARSNPTKSLVQTDIVLLTPSPIDENESVAMHFELLRKEVQRELARLSKK
jgi:hypothetical protein